MTINYGNKKIKGIYLGTQNTNCITNIPNDINLTLDPLNATITGAITNDNGILSGFNKEIYASTNITASGTEDLIFKAKVTTHKSYNAVFSSLSKNCVIGFNSLGKPSLRLEEWHGGKTVYSTGTWVWCRFVWDGSKVYLYSLADNGYTLNTLPALSSWVLEYSTSKNDGYFGGDTLDIGWSDVSTNYYFDGSIDITQSQVKIGDKVIWRGGTGKLTLKKGSKVYVPNGAGKFDEIDIKSNMLVTLNSDRQSFLYYYNGGLYFADALDRCVSGNTDTFAGQQWHVWYDTTNNIIKRYTGDATTPAHTGMSLPLAIITVSNGAISSIDQVFNGFGYIGGTFFVLPNVEGNASNGLNADGSYNVIPFKTSKVVLRTDSSSNGSLSYALVSNGNTLTRYEYFTLRKDGYLYGYNTTKIIGTEVAKITYTNYQVTSLTINPVQPKYIGREISRIYNGSTLVYGYKPNTVLLEKSTAGTYTLNLEHSGDYEVTIVGGGGGGAYNASKKFSDGVISGGSGAGFKGIIHLKAGTHTVKVGAGGTSVNPGNQPTAMPGVGSSSSIGNIITAGCANEDGTANAGVHGSGNVISKGGVLRYDSSVVKSYTLATNGNDGLEGWNTSVEGAASVISGTTYGAGDKGQNGAMSKGYDGYVKIVAK